MSTLFLVGMGIVPGEFPPLAVDVVSSCGKVFCETYTSMLPGLSMARMETAPARKVSFLKRSEVEEGTVLIDALSEGDAALLVPGDPMISTTHISLLVQAARAGHTTRILHSTSIISAAMGESCLQATRFGRMATISFHSSLQPYDVLSENRKRGLHTLFLLDVDSERNRYMSIGEALHSLLRAETERGTKVLGRDILAIGLARVGHEDQLVVAGPIAEVLKVNFGRPPHSLVIPGDLHFAESEAVEVLLRKSS